jgi:hypothetical protein
MTAESVPPWPPQLRGTSKGESLADCSVTYDQG